MSHRQIELVKHPEPYPGWGVARFPLSNPLARTTCNFGRDGLLDALEFLAAVLCGPRCVECHEPMRFDRMMPTVQRRMDEQGVCHRCLHWRDHAADYGPHVAIISGDHFIIRPDQPRGYRGFLGHGGAEFRIRFNDGREVVTHNLWSQGDIPEWFRERLPDNAVFVRVGDYAGYCGHGSAHAHEAAQ